MSQPVRCKKCADLSDVASGYLIKLLNGKGLVVGYAHFIGKS